jgi:hypothetical protein
MAKQVYQLVETDTHTYASLWVPVLAPNLHRVCHVQSTTSHKRLNPGSSSLKDHAKAARRPNLT